MNRPTNEPGPDLNLDEVGYIGHSMGAVIGGVSGAMLPELKRVLLNVAGGRCSEVLFGNEISGEVEIPNLRPRDIANGDAWRMVAMVQASFDPGDPINYAAHIGRDPFARESPRPLLLQNSLHDFLMPNQISFGLARAVEAPLVGPYFMEIPNIET